MSLIASKIADLAAEWSIAKETERAAIEKRREIEDAIGRLMKLPDVLDGTERLDALEFKIAHLERAVQELSDVLYRQQQQLDAALAMNQRLGRQLEEIEGRTGDSTPVEIPPHY